MKDRQQQLALAELDGLRWMRDPNDNCWCWYNEELKCFTGKNLFETDDSIDWEALPAYQVSYDDILPLIHKQSFEIRGQILVMLKTLFNCFYTIDASPSQLCEALLRATGKWIE
jgi:hypothetical protein